MLKVMLVDDEPFILQGLQVLIDWESEGFTIVKLAENGKIALDYLKEHKVDLILADIKMPVLGGLGLLEEIRNQKISDALFVILTGYNDFQYIQTALRNDCMDYILKPVQQDELRNILHRAAVLKEHSFSEEILKKQMEENQTERKIVQILQGKAGKKAVEDIKEHLLVDGPVRYVHVGLDIVNTEEELTDMELTEYKESLYEHCKTYLGEAAGCCFSDMIGYEKDNEIAIIFSEKMLRFSERTEHQFFMTLCQELQGKINVPLYLLIGKKVENIAQLGHSYTTACMLRSFIGFCKKKSVYYYEEEIQIERSSIVLCKKTLDCLIEAVKNNNKPEMSYYLDALYSELDRTEMDEQFINMNIHYLLFQLIHLAVEQDETVNQEEIMQHISETVFENHADRGSRSHMRKFVLEYGEYLSQLNPNVSGGILKEIEREIRENYAENLTLKELSQKYYINSSYLGQIFRKQYGQSFRDYLSAYRISKAEQLLLHTEKKISVIAEEVGYKDIDYFINRFISLKGVTPARFRRSNDKNGI